MFYLAPRAGFEPAKLPKFNDKALAKFVAEVRETNDARESVEFSDPWYEHPPLRASDFLDSMEREAIEAAEDGNLKPLGDMIKNPLFKNSNRTLSPRAWALISASSEGHVQG